MQPADDRPRGRRFPSPSGSTRSPGTACAALLVAGLWLGLGDDGARAQVPRLNATGGKVQRLTHSGISEPQPFPEVRWIAVNPQGNRGAVVQMTCAPFANTLFPGARVDTRLDLRVTQSLERAGWQVLTPSDQTELPANAPAEVIAMSRARGNGQFGIVVTFVNHDVSVLFGGEYETTLVGTITEN